MRYLYLAFLLAFAVTLFGFWPTTVGAFGPPDAIRIAHGGFAIAWMALLVLQSWLIGRPYYRWHRQIGWTSIVIVPGLVISALIVVHDALRPDTHFGTQLLLTLVWIDLWSLGLFVLLYGLALYHRRRMFLHARFMASTVFVALIPALGRVYGMNFPAIGGLRGALNPSFWTVEIVLVGLIVRDGLNKKWRTPWWLTFIGLILIQLTMFAAPSWAPFSHAVWAMAPTR